MWKHRLSFRHQTWEAAKYWLSYLLKKKKHIMWDLFCLTKTKYTMNTFEYRLPMCVLLAPFVLIIIWRLHVFNFWREREMREAVFVIICIRHKCSLHMVWSNTPFGFKHSETLWVSALVRSPKRRFEVVLNEHDLLRQNYRACIMRETQLVEPKLNLKMSGKSL